MKKIFLLVLILVAVLVYSAYRKKEVEKDKAADIEEGKKQKSVIRNNVKGYETLDTGKYGVVTFSKATYDYLSGAANAIARDLIEKGGHWDTWWAYEFVEKLNQSDDQRKLWYLGYLIKKAANIQGSLAERADRENWRMFSWTYLSARDADRLAELGRGFVAAMARVGI